MPVRKASAAWDGGLKTGKGTLKTETGAASGAYNFGSRFESGAGTNPEELLAASMAACFSMALSGALERAGKTAERVSTDAACTVEKVGEGFKVTKMQLVTRVETTGLPNDELQQIADKVKDACPIGAVMKGNVDVTVEARLE